MTISGLTSTLYSAYNGACRMIGFHEGDPEPTSTAEQESSIDISTICDPIIRKFELTLLAMKEPNTKLGLKGSSVSFYEPWKTQGIWRWLYSEGKQDIIQTKALETAIDIPLETYPPDSPHAKALASCDDITAIALEQLKKTYKDFAITSHIETFREKCEGNFNKFKFQNSQHNDDSSTPSSSLLSIEELNTPHIPITATSSLESNSSSPLPSSSENTSIDAEAFVAVAIKPTEEKIITLMKKLWEDPEEINRMAGNFKTAYKHYTSEHEHERIQAQRDIQVLETLLATKRTAFQHLVKEDIKQRYSVSR